MGAYAAGLRSEGERGPASKDVFGVAKRGIGGGMRLARRERVSACNCTSFATCSVPAVLCSGYIPHIASVGFLAPSSQLRLKISRQLRTWGLARRERVSACNCTSFCIVSSSRVPAVLCSGNISHIASVGFLAPICQLCLKICAEPIHCSLAALCCLHSALCCPLR
eukprot:694902-Rhodomonas_salina.1